MLITSNGEGKTRTLTNYVDNNVESEYCHQDKRLELVWVRSLERPHEDTTQISEEGTLPSLCWCLWRDRRWGWSCSVRKTADCVQLLLLALLLVKRHCWFHASRACQEAHREKIPPSFSCLPSVSSIPLPDMEHLARQKWGLQSPIASPTGQSIGWSWSWEHQFNWHSCFIRIQTFIKKC